MKYLLILLLSFQVNAADEQTTYMVTGLCKVMLDQTNTANITAEFLDYWKDIAKSSDYSFAKYHELCDLLATEYDKEKLKKGEKAKGGKL